MEIEEISQVYMCGPSGMVGSLVNLVDSSEIPEDKYTVI